MEQTLATVHQLLGYVVVLVVLFSAVTARQRAKEAREYRNAPYAATLVLLDIQVLLGLVVYGVAGGWDYRPETAYVHPLLALLGLVLGHAMLGRAKRLQLAVEAHRGAGRALIAAFVLIALSVGVASAPAFI